MSEVAVKFAESVGAKIVLPTDPKRRINLYDKTDVTKTWAMHAPVDFDKPVTYLRRKAK